MAVIAEGGPAGRGLAEYMKWRNRRKLLKGLGRNRPTMNTPAIPLPKDVMERGGTPAVPMPTVTGAMPGTIPKDVMVPRGIPNALNIGQSGPPRRNSYRHHPGGYNIPANASLTPESQAVRDYQGFVSEGSPHTYANYPMTSAGPDAIARQDYERSRNVIEPFSWYKGNEGWFTKRPISDKLKSMMRKETGAAMTPNEMKMFMGMPVRSGIPTVEERIGMDRSGYGGGKYSRLNPRRTDERTLHGDKNVTRSGDTAEWNPSESIYPRHFIDTLLEQGVITLEEVFDMGASDGDSFKIIPRGTGRFDSTRRA